MDNVFTAILISVIAGVITDRICNHLNKTDHTKDK